MLFSSPLFLPYFVIILRNMFPVFQLSKQDCRGKDRSENMGDGFAFDSDNDPFKFTPTSNGNSPKKGGYQAEFDKFAYHSPEHASHFEVDTKLSGEIKPGETGLSSLNTSSSDFESEEMSGVKLESSVVKPESKEFHIEGKYSDSKELVDFPIIKQDFSKIEIPNKTVIPSKLCKSTIVSDKLETVVPMSWTKYGGAIAGYIECVTSSIPGVL